MARTDAAYETAQIEAEIAYYGARFDWEALPEGSPAARAACRDFEAARGRWDGVKRLPEAVAEEEGL